MTVITCKWSINLKLLPDISSVNFDLFLWTLGGIPLERLLTVHTQLWVF